jgi:hypothetical protein
MDNEILNKNDIKFLQELANNLITQDNRGTRLPLIYSVRHEEKNWGMDNRHQDGEALIIDGEIDLETKEEIKDFLFDYLEEDKLKDIENLDNLSLYEIKDLIKENVDCVVEICGYINTYKHTGAFLTEKECEQHIKNNRHHYKNPCSYAHHAWRNYELSELIRIIMKFKTIDKDVLHEFL